MRIDEHNLDSLRRVIRDLQQENENLKVLLDRHQIAYEQEGRKEDCTDVQGIYPLFPDNTCRFLVFDFDNHEKDSYKNDDANTDDLWKSEVDGICEMNGIDVLVERSRSARGAHLWIFYKAFRILTSMRRRDSCFCEEEDRWVQGFLWISQGRS